MRSRVLTVGGLVVLAALSGLTASSVACQTHAASPRASPMAQAAALPASCPGRAIRQDRVITGSFGRELQSSFVMVPFQVPAGTTAVRVKYCYDQPESPTSSTPTVNIRHTLDLGLYSPRAGGSRVWGTRELRGWGGSSHPDVTVSAEGFSTERQYLAKPQRVEVPGKTTRAFRPGAIQPGLWAAELGVAAVASQSEGDSDGKVAWRVEIELARNPGFADEPYRPARYDPTPARSSPGWYAGDLHVHAEHSDYGAAAMSEAFGYAFRPLSQGGAGLDFINLTDYVSGASWTEVGRYQRRYRGNLIGRSAEVITYRGHLINHNTVRVMDYRTGPLFERRPDGSLTQLRGARPASDILRAIRGAGGFTQIAHPTIFPPTVPGFANFCRGCSWEYSPDETDYSQVDGIEVATAYPSTGFNPFIATAVQFYEQALAAGHRIAALGVSDSHNAGRAPNSVTQSPIGKSTTVVFAEQLSEPGIECGVEARHTYAKVTGNEGPDLRFEATPGGGGGKAIMGDVVQASGAQFSARVLGGAGRDLIVFKDGSPFATVPVSGEDFTHRFADGGAGRYRLQLQRDDTIETVSSPIWLEPGPGRVVSRDCTPLSVRGSVRRRSRVRRGRFAARCTARGAGLRACAAKAVIRTGRPGRRRTRTLGQGRVRMTGGSRRMRIRLNRRGRRLLRRHRLGRRVRVVFTVNDGDGAQASDRRRTRLRRARR